MIAQEKKELIEANNIPDSISSEEFEGDTIIGQQAMQILIDDSGTDMTHEEFEKEIEKW